MSMYKPAIVCFAALLILGASCVIRTEHTIDAHITLDIRHIEEQAEDVLKFIDGETDTLPDFTETEEASDAAPPNPESDSTSWLRRAFDALNPMPVAYAQELKSSSALVTEIAKRLRERNPKIDALKKAGCLGETNRGYVELRDCDALDDAEKRNEAQQLLAEENKDRKALYREIARLNTDQQGVTVSKVERIYAQQRLKRAAGGEIFQLPPRGEDFEEFEKSSKGKQLGDKCKPEAWVKMP